MIRYGSWARVTRNWGANFVVGLELPPTERGLEESAPDDCCWQALVEAFKHNSITRVDFSGNEAFPFLTNLTG